MGESPRPAEILQRQQQQQQMQQRWTASGEGSVITTTTTTTTPQMPAQAQAVMNDATDSSEKSSRPQMGVFGPPGHANRRPSTSGKVSAVIGKQTAKGSIPSPFAKLAHSAGPDAGTAGGGTSTAASSPVRGRKRRASVSGRFVLPFTFH